MSRLLLGIFFWAICIDAKAEALPMKTLDSVLSELKSSGDMTGASYFMKRCSAYSIATFRLLESSGGSSAVEAANSYKAHAANLLGYAATIEEEIDKQRNKKNVKSLRQHTEESGKAIASMANIYIDRMNDNYVRSGNYVVDDPWLKGEAGLCKDPIQVLESLFK